MLKMIDSPEELRDEFIRMFPEIAKEFQEEEGLDYGYKMPLTYHAVWSAFVSMSSSYLNISNVKTIKELCEIINNFVSEGGNKENSVSTCLLEHASQLKIRNFLKPYLSAEAKRELR